MLLGDGGRLGRRLSARAAPAQDARNVIDDLIVGLALAALENFLIGLVLRDGVFACRLNSSSEMMRQMDASISSIVGSGLGCDRKCRPAGVIKIFP